MYKTVLIEEITIENATTKINGKVQEMEKAVLVFRKELKGSLR